VQVQRVVASKEDRERVESQIHQFGKPGTVSVLEIDLAFPPLDSLATSLARLLHAGGASCEHIEQLLGTGHNLGCTGADDVELATAEDGFPRTVVEELVGVFEQESDRSGMVVLVAGAGQGGCMGS
jgi:hypothetical protein